MSDGTYAPVARDLTSTAPAAVRNEDPSADGQPLVTPILVRPQKKKSYWSPAARRIVNAYKEEYLALENHLEKAQLLIDKVLPDIFNHWDATGTRPNGDDSQTRLQILKKYCQNNWRRQGHKPSTAHLKVRLRDVVRKTMQTEVENALADMSGSDEAEPGTVQYFAKKNLAISRVIENLTQEERQALERTAAQWSQRGYPAAEQRRQVLLSGILPRQSNLTMAIRMAEKKSTAKLVQADREHWLQMGMVSLTFAAYIGKDGQWTLKVHDTIAENMGVVRQPFKYLYKDLVREMSIKLMDYVRSLKESVTSEPLNTSATQYPLQIKSGEGGFPEVPTVTKDQYTKTELVLLLRKYWSMHYELASGRSQTRVPFAAISANVAAFIAPEYLPEDGTNTIQDPQNMRKAEIEELLLFWKAREVSHGIHSAFRWTAYVKNNVRLPAEYGARYDVAAATAATKAKRQRRAKAKNPKPSAARSAPAHAAPLGGVTAEPQAMQVRNGTAAADLPVIQTAAGLIPDEDTHVMVTHAQMQELVKNGYRAVTPLNGPADGDGDGPQYCIPLEDFEKYSPIPGQPSASLGIVGNQSQCFPGPSTLPADTSSIAAPALPVPLPPASVFGAIAGPSRTVHGAVASAVAPVPPHPMPVPAAPELFPGTLPDNSDQIQPLPAYVRHHVKLVNAAAAAGIPPLPTPPYTGGSTSADPAGEPIPGVPQRKRKAPDADAGIQPKKAKKQIATERRQQAIATSLPRQTRKQTARQQEAASAPQGMGTRLRSKRTAQQGEAASAPQGMEIRLSKRSKRQ
ncbi:hypothetical protein LshimejAT787_1901400 [Lyophyllum shimeji]|uniref:Uncharacterized protein n=1 Tax=Lyophyllum shimeji TaxID=47721 RepID=A0A9P3Q1G7_LYOSH|nr:hypothetical protein LshimejAT787_1901400 [Lyophyllum shimeji]